MQAGMYIREYMWFWYESVKIQQYIMYSRAISQLVAFLACTGARAAQVRNYKRRQNGSIDKFRTGKSFLFF